MADLNGKKIAYLATDMDEIPAFNERLLEEFAKTPVGASRS